MQRIEFLLRALKQLQRFLQGLKLDALLPFLFLLEPHHLLFHPPVLFLIELTATTVTLVLVILVHVLVRLRLVCLAAHEWLWLRCE